MITSKSVTPDQAVETTRSARVPDALIDGDEVKIACYRDGDPSRPTIVFVHGYPDTAGVWDAIVEILSETFHCVRYDVRGAGESGRPRATRAYRLVHLTRDLAAVIDWACPDAGPVHLVGHDWGSSQSWEAATDPAFAHRLRSFTSISGPCLDHIGHAARAQWRDDRSALMRQLRRSWYVGLFQLPWLAAFGWRHLIAPRWQDTLTRLEDAPLRVAPTLIADGVDGIKLYRANVLARLFAPRARHATVPVHLIVARRDPFVGAGLARGVSPWAADLTIDEIDAGHWAIASQSVRMAELCRLFFSHLSEREEAS